MYNFKIYFLLFIIYAFLGWVIEEINEVVTTKKFVNRGFLIGPYCPIYGFGGLIITFLLTKYNNDLLILFVLSVVIFSCLEYFTSYLLEKLFDARWWDYTNRKYNLNGRICLETMIPFGLLGIFVIHYSNPFILKILTSLSSEAMSATCYTLFAIFFIDIIVSTIMLNSVKSDIEKVDKDNTEEITKKVKEILSENWFTRRLVKAFPNFIYIGKVIKENAIRIITKEQQEEEKIRIDTEAKIKKMKIDYEYRVSKLREKANMKIEKIKKKKKEK